MYLIEEDKIEELRRIRNIINKLSFLIVIDLVIKCLWLYGFNLHLLYSVICGGFLIDRFDRITVYLIRNFDVNQLYRIELLNHENMVFRRINVNDGGEDMN